MLINLLPDFFAVLNSSDRTAAYHRYLAAHGPLLDAYWHSYVVDPDTPHVNEIVRHTISADRADLRAVLERVDIVTMARNAERQCRELLLADVDVDVVLMVGVGAANAGELVVDGRGTAFVCLEHFTGAINETSNGLGLDPELVPMWLAHEYAHAVRYTSPTSRSELRDLVAQAGGNYSFWDTARRATLRELLVNEGLAVHVSRAVSPGHAAWEYFGYARRQYARIRELETVVTRAATDEFDRIGIGYRLRFLSDGTNDDTRAADKYVLPDRSGYYLGAKLCDAAVSMHGLPWAVRAAAAEITELGSSFGATA